MQILLDPLLTYYDVRQPKISFNRFQYTFTMKFQLQIRQKHRRYLRKFRNCEQTFAPFDSNTEQHANFAKCIAEPEGFTNICAYL